MPTTDTALLAQIQALRSKPPKPDQKYDKMGQILREVDEGTGQGLRSLTRLVTHPLESLDEMVESTKQFVREPRQTVKAIKQSLSTPEGQHNFIGQMLVPDPSRLIKALRGTKALPKADIVVPETLALPSERVALEKTKRWGMPDYETGWFEGPDKLYRKEIGPVQFDLSKIPEPGEWFRDDFFDHPDLLERLQSKGMFQEVPGFQMDELGKDSLLGRKFGAMFGGEDNEIIIGERFRTMPEKLQKELLSHELQHAVQLAGYLKPGFRGSSPGHGVSMRRYLQNPGEIEARAAAARDYLLDPRYREIVPFDWNTRKMAERLRHGMNKPEPEGPREFLEDMEQWLQLTEK